MNSMIGKSTGIALLMAAALLAALFAMGVFSATGSGGAGDYSRRIYDVQPLQDHFDGRAGRRERPTLQQLPDT